MKRRGIQPRLQSQSHSIHNLTPSWQLTPYALPEPMQPCFFPCRIHYTLTVALQSKAATYNDGLQLIFFIKPRKDNPFLLLTEQSIAHRIQRFIHNSPLNPAPFCRLLNPVSKAHPQAVCIIYQRIMTKRYTENNQFWGRICNKCGDSIKNQVKM